MQYIIALIFIIGVFFQKTPKLYSVCFLFFMIIIFGLNDHHVGYSNYYNMDFNNYYTLYLGNSLEISDRDTEIGFQYLMLISNQFGLSFNAFRLILGLFGYILLANSINKFSKYLPYVLALYFIFPFPNDVIQIRNFFSMSIIIFSIRYLVANKRFNNIKFVTLIFLASTIHFTSLFYLIFLLAKKFNKKTIVKIVVFVVPILIVLAFTPAFPILISLFSDDAKFMYYFSRRTTYGLIAVFGIVVMIFVTFYIMYKQCIKQIEIIDFNSRKKNGKYFNRDFYEMLMKINILLLLTTPLLIYDFNFIRLYRNILPLNYIVFVDAIVLMRLNRNKAFNYFIVALFFVVFFFIYFYGLNADTQIFPVFEDNILFK